MEDLVLIGMMGSGKSTVGKRLAELRGQPFQDTDSLLQYRLGRPIPQLFSLYGEDTFRQHETALLRSLQPPIGILATGGGIVMKEENWKEMRRLGRVVFLHVSPEIILNRLAISRKRRPLIEVEDWEDKVEEIYASRLGIYLQADLTVTVDEDDFETVIAKILAEVTA